LEIPEDLREQDAVVDVLEAFDHELDALSKLLAKTRSIRQGMMQQLLTGRTRFRNTEGAQ
jgi:type I restriction enzyme S subunit